MRHSLSTILTPAICGAVAALGLAIAAPASAQTVEELTIYGRVGPDGEAKSLSQPVSYADLDLRYKDAQDELRRRIDFTARDLCDQLGETGDSDPIAPPCRDAAVRDGMRQAKFAIDDAYASGPYQAAYAAPYPTRTEWVPPDDEDY